jgi:hypothetical protein
VREKIAALDQSAGSLTVAVRLHPQEGDGTVTISLKPVGVLTVCYYDIKCA